MIVTTSRKPAPELRSLARDLAFALDCDYIIRGKMGLAALGSLDPVAVYLYLKQGNMVLQVIANGDIRDEFVISSVTVTGRQGPLTKGLRVGDQSIYDRLAPYIPVKLSDDRDGLSTIDGRQSRRYLLRLSAP